MNNLYKMIVLKTDIPNNDGRIYPSSVMNDAIKNYYDNAINLKKSFGELNPKETPIIALHNISHIVTKLDHVDNVVTCELNILNTPSGELVLNKMHGDYKLDKSFRLMPRGIGTVVNDVVTKFNIISIDIIKK